VHVQRLAEGDLCVAAIEQTVSRVCLLCKRDQAAYHDTGKDFFLRQVMADDQVWWLSLRLSINPHCPRDNMAESLRTITPQREAMRQGKTVRTPQHPRFIKRLKPIGILRGCRVLNQTGMKSIITVTPEQKLGMRGEQASLL
jgi:hypothetical protein